MGDSGKRTVRRGRAHTAFSCAVFFCGGGRHFRRKRPPLLRLAGHPSAGNKRPDTLRLRAGGCPRRVSGQIPGFRRGEVVPPGKNERPAIRPGALRMSVPGRRIYRSPPLRLPQTASAASRPMPASSAIVRTDGAAPVFGLWSPLFVLPPADGKGVPFGT